MKIVSVNIERDKHLDTVIPFLQHENPDVVCFQEIMEPSVSKIAGALGAHATFAPFAVLEGFEKDTDGKVMGVALLSKKPHKVKGVHYYQGNGNVGVIRKSDILEIEKLHEILSRAVLVCDLEDEHGNVYIVGTTHFTYTPDGEPDNGQMVALKKLIEVLTPYHNLILTGDFNIPRANGLYGKLCSEFVDNIPSHIESSLDSELHRVKGLKRMVDYFWTRGLYQVEDIRLEDGVSDHCAVVGVVSAREG